ncbi:MAG TPA: hypothetical protein VIX80_10560 [Candidatus Kapabacteria bacterium]
MKYLIILIIASTCIGCAGTRSDYKGKGGPFTISTQAESLSGCYILSIRDTEIVVVQGDFSVPHANDTSGAFIIRNKSIKSIVHWGLSGMDPWGTVGGYVVGTAAGLAISFPISYLTDSDKPAQVALILGPIVGLFVGGFTLAPQSTFDITKFNDRELLVYLCKYCGHEPEYIDKIK